MVSVTRRLLAVLLSVLILVAAGCSGKTASNASQQPPTQGGTTSASPTPVKIAAFPGSFASLPVFVANERGLFKKHNLNVTIMDVKGGSQSGQALLAGAVDFALVAIEEVISMNAKGKAVQEVVGGTTRLPFTFIAANKVDLPHAKEGYPAVIRDLKGLRLGITSKGSSTDYVMRWLLKDAGMDPDKDAKIINAGLQAEAIAALQSNQIDTYLATDPTTTIATKVKKIARPVLSIFKGEGPSLLTDYMLNGLAAQKTYIDSHPEVVKNLYAAIAEADEYIAGLKDESRAKQAAEELHSEYTGVDVSTLADILRNTTELYSPKIDPQMIKNANTLMKSFGLTDKEFGYEQLVWQNR